ncbi:MAG: N-acetyl-gamma-glutamyl-phosphate reductase [Spirochaetaceae bacterium]|nr:N-acetyl-gamma-glutamyl-phosphate reductase [Spirochaetaceae bacterium]
MKAGILGAAGYAGAELCRLLASHPNIDRLCLSSTSFEGKSIEDVYPNFLKRVSVVLENADEVAASSDVVFAALPAGLSEEFAKKCFDKDIPFIDISADFRFDDDEATYSNWYGKQYKYPELHKKSVYGLPELNRQKIKEAASPAIIANPGCYPTAATLGAMPALKLGIAGDGIIIADAYSGITGGGREPARSYHFPECSDAVSPYKVGAHRHTPEISRNFAHIERRLENQRPVIFTPHLAPMNRGILCTLYIPLAEKYKILNGLQKPVPPHDDIKTLLSEIHKMYSNFYKEEKFVRVLPVSCCAATNRVRMSNYCDISVHIDQNASTLIIISAIDNMVKGAAGQAVQNMNILFNLKETLALEAIPALF